jgi:hypothetical protein
MARHRLEPGLRHHRVESFVGEAQHAVGHALRPHVATSSFPSLTLTFATPAGAGGTGLFRSTKSSQGDPSVPQGKLGVAG